MTISSRTPDGSPNRCPVCGKDVNITPCNPAGDATCPYCGSLLWFVIADVGMLFYRKIGPLHADGSAIWPDAPDLDESILAEDREPTEVSIGDHVRVIAGQFQNFEGDVDTINHEKGRITVRVNIFGRSTAVELESRQLQRIEA